MSNSKDPFTAQGAPTAVDGGSLGLTCVPPSQQPQEQPQTPQLPLRCVSPGVRIYHDATMHCQPFVRASPALGPVPLMRPPPSREDTARIQTAADHQQTTSGQPIVRVFREDAARTPGPTPAKPCYRACLAAYRVDSAAYTAGVTRARSANLAMAGMVPKQMEESSQSPQGWFGYAHATAQRTSTSPSVHKELMTMDRGVQTCMEAFGPYAQLAVQEADQSREETPGSPPKQKQANSALAGLQNLLKELEQQMHAGSAMLSQSWELDEGSPSKQEEANSTLAGLQHLLEELEQQTHASYAAEPSQSRELDEGSPSKQKQANSALAGLQHRLEELERQMHAGYAELSQSWEKRLAALEQVLDTSLKAASVTASSMNDRLAKFVGLAEVLEGAVRQVLPSRMDLESLSRQIRELEESTDCRIADLRNGLACLVCEFTDRVAWPDQCSARRARVNLEEACRSSGKDVLLPSRDDFNRLVRELDAANDHLSTITQEISRTTGGRSGATTLPGEAERGSQQLEWLDCLHREIQRLALGGPAHGPGLQFGPRAAKEGAEREGETGAGSRVVSGSAGSEVSQRLREAAASSAVL